MNAAILDGKQVALGLKHSLTQHLTTLRQHGARVPGLAVILLGNDPASCIYVQHKRKACFDIGMHSVAYNLPAHTSEQELLELISSLNTQPEIDGILVQLPLPAHINTLHIIAHIDPCKDVDGFHPHNLGLLTAGNPFLRPCTPFGIIQLLEHYAITLEGLNAVVIGASNIVGRPMALELLLAKSSVSICHRATRSLEPYVRMADVLVVAAGVADIIQPAWLAPHQIVIDVGMHRLPNGSLRGDIDFAAASKRVAWITPVPGGVGPMTLCALLQNTLMAYQANLTQVAAATTHDEQNAPD